MFCNRKRDITTLFRSLERHGYNVGALHGDMDQRTRMMMLENFRKGNITLLVASDVAARGLDIPEVSHVFNYDVPSHAEDYVHRIGRTGRAGRSGVAYTLVTPDDQKYLDAIEKLINNPIEWEGEPIDFETAAKERKARRRSKTAKPEATDGKPSSRTTAEKPASRSTAEKPASKSTAEKPSRRKKADNDDTVITEDTQPKPRRRPARQEQSDSSSSRPSPRSKPDRNEPAFGRDGHVPAFLLREPRPKKVS